MTPSPQRFHRSHFVVAPAAVLIGAAGSLTAIAALAPAGQAAPYAGDCAQAHHKFVEATGATYAHHQATVTAHPATFHCGGPDDGHYNVKEKQTVTLTVPKGAEITVFKKYNDPDKTKHISASELPKYLKKNRGEPVYEFHGPKRQVTAFDEQFHP